MNADRMRWLQVLLTVAMVTILNACGGGGVGAPLSEGGTSGTGTNDPAPDPEPLAAGVSSGEINGFGSVRVNGIRYLTSADDAGIATEFSGPVAGFAESDLAAGMLVQVIWEQDDEGATRRALRISYLPELIGTVSASLDVQSNRMQVAGRTVAIAPGAVFDDVYGRNAAGVPTLTGPELLEAGSDRVEVSGFLIVADPTTGGSLIQASRIARVDIASADPDATTSVTGFVSNPDDDGGFDLLDVSGSVIRVTVADVSVVAPSLLVDAAGLRFREGQAVRVTGRLDASEFSDVSRVGRVLTDLGAVEVELPEQAQAEIAGPITQAQGNGILRIANQGVIIDDATEFLGGTTEAMLSVGRRATARGVIEAGDHGEQQLRAASLFVEPEAEVKLEDLVTSGIGPMDDNGNRSFETRIGLTVLIRPSTILKDDTDASPDGRLDPDTIEPDDYVELRGFFDPEGRLVAVKLEREDFDDECEFEARVLGSAVIGGERRYTIANRPGMVIVDLDNDLDEEEIPPGGLGEFESDDPSLCMMRPGGVDLDGNPVDAGFFAEDVDREDDGPDDDDDDD